MPLVLTGVNSAIGVSGRNGIELAAQRINASGGIRGRPIELIIRDDGDDPTQALKVDQELQTLGVVALVGHMTSKSGLKAIPWADSAGLLLISPTISSVDWSGKDDYFFRTIGSNDLQGRALALEALKRGYKRAAIFMETGNGAFTKAVSGTFANDFVAGGATIVLSQSFASVKDLDHAAIAKSAIGSHPDVILFAASAYDTALFAQELSKAKVTIPIFGSMWSMTEDLFVQGGRSIEGIVVSGTTDTRSTGPDYVHFKGDYRAAYGVDPSFGAVHGYNALMLLAAAAKADRIDSAAIKQSILKIKRFPGLQTDITIDENGDCTRSYRLFEARGGIFAALD